MFHGMHRGVRPFECSQRDRDYKAARNVASSQARSDKAQHRTTVFVHEISGNVQRKAPDKDSRLFSAFRRTAIRTLRMLLQDIQDGTFAREWISENHEGAHRFKAMREAEADSQLEKVGAELRSMMPFLKKKS